MTTQQTATSPTRRWTYHDESALMKRTRELLVASPQTDIEIYNATQIQPTWLAQFKAGKIPNPGVNRVEALYNYLSGKPLTVG